MNQRKENNGENCLGKDRSSIRKTDFEQVIEINEEEIKDERNNKVC